MAVVLEVVAHGLCFAAGGADLAGDDADHVGRHPQLFEYREGVVDAAGDLKKVLIRQVFFQDRCRFSYVLSGFVLEGLWVR